MQEQNVKSGQLGQKNPAAHKASGTGHTPDQGKGGQTGKQDGRPKPDQQDQKNSH